MLQAAGIIFKRNDKNVLNNVSLELVPGRLTALLGPNGAGKSTLAKILSGEWRPAAGKVLAGGRELEKWEPSELARIRAVLPQESTLSFPFTVLDVVMMGRMPHLAKDEAPRDEAICREVLRRMDMEALASQLYTNLSGGEKQRVQLARVLAQIWEPAEGKNRCLILDEPTANLDLAHRHAILQIAREMASAGAAVLFILHDLNLALAYANHVLVLKKGETAASGPVREVLTPELVQDVFAVRAEWVRGPETGRPFLATFPFPAPKKES